MQKYPEKWRERAHVIPQGHVGAIPPAAPPRSGPLRIVYTGRFYDGIRTPDTFLRSIAEANRASSLDRRLQVEFIGAHMDRYEAVVRELGLSTIVRWAGRVSPAEARRRAAQADVLLVIDAASNGPSLFLPSKLIDYLPLGRPILAITPPQGPVADIIGELGYIAVDPADAGRLTTTIRRLVADHESG